MSRLSVLEVLAWLLIMTRMRAAPLGKTANRTLAYGDSVCNVIFPLRCQASAIVGFLPVTAGKDVVRECLVR